MFELFRRGMEGVTPEYLAQLHADAQAYERAGPEMEVKPQHLMPVMVTGAILMVILVSIGYTLNQVVASLAMIESPSSVQIVEAKLPPYTDEPLVEDAAGLKTGSAEVVDVEVTLIHTKPITRKIRSTMAHLKKNGGFTSRWRGLPIYAFYLLLRTIVATLFRVVLPFGFATHTIAEILTSLALCRVHMAWVQSIVAAPQEGKGVVARFVHRMKVARKMSTGKALLLPTLVYAVSYQCATSAPFFLTQYLSLHDPDFQKFVASNGDFSALHAKEYLFVLGASLLIFSVVSLAVVLPAATALTRIEAALLPEDEDTLVPFDRAALIGEVDLTLRGGATALFLQAWRSVDRSTIFRLVRMYVKINAIQFGVTIMGVGIMIAETLALVGPSLALLYQSGSAQLQLMTIEAAQPQ